MELVDIALVIALESQMAMQQEMQTRRMSFLTRLLRLAPDSAHPVVFCTGSHAPKDQHGTSIARSHPPTRAGACAKTRMCTSTFLIDKFEQLMTRFATACVHQVPRGKIRSLSGQYRCKDPKPERTQIPVSTCMPIDI
jgi:hypothetical protein